MRKILVLVSLLVLAAACATEQPANKDMTANANKGGETKSAAAPSESDIIAKEKAAWDAFRKKDVDAFKKTLAPEYIEVTDSGVKDTAATVADMSDIELSDVQFADWKMRTIDKDALLITYTVKVKGTFKGQPMPPGPYREASAYVNRNGEWLAIYYQETLTSTAPPPPTPAAGSAAKPAASAAKPAEPGPDATANEKAVWDMFKAKNWDGFASFLASDFTEVEAEAVYDKTGAVKSVEGFDFSKVELSDWKTVKFDNDASVVTYTAKFPGMKPEKQYHATIWANRDGKWQAAFHMGTPQGEPMPAAPEKKASPSPAK